MAALPPPAKQDASGLPLVLPCSKILLLESLLCRAPPHFLTELPGGLPGRVLLSLVINVASCSSTGIPLGTQAEAESSLRPPRASQNCLFTCPMVQPWGHSPEPRRREVQSQDCPHAPLTTCSLTPPSTPSSIGNWYFSF